MSVAAALLGASGWDGGSWGCWCWWGWPAVGAVDAAGVGLMWRGGLEPVREGVLPPPPPPATPPVPRAGALVPPVMGSTTPAGAAGVAGKGALWNGDVSAGDPAASGAADICAFDLFMAAGVGVAVWGGRGCCGRVGLLLAAVAGDGAVAVAGGGWLLDSGRCARSDGRTCSAASWRLAVSSVGRTFAVAGARASG